MSPCSGELTQLLSNKIDLIIFRCYVSVRYQYNFRFYLFIYGSSARSVLSDEVDEISYSENDFGDDLVLEWAKVRRLDY